MNLISEQKIIGAVSGLLIVAYIVAYCLGLTNPAVPLIDVKSVGFLNLLSYGMAACLLPYFFLDRPAKERLIVFGVGIVLDMALFWVLSKFFLIEYLSFLAFMLSLIGFSISAIWVTVISSSAHNYSKSFRIQLINYYVFVLVVQLVLTRILDVTFALEPITYDGVVFHLDAMFGFYPTIQMAKIVYSSESLKDAVNLFYEWIPALFPILFVLQIKQKSAPPANILLVWAVSSVALIAYQFCPVAGPLYFFGQLNFPNNVPPIGDIPTEGIILLQSTYRNGFPSLHFGGALLFIFAGRYLKSMWLNLFLSFCCLLTAVAILGNGEHYLMDLIVSVPFVIAIQSFCTHVSDAGKRARLQAIGVGAGLWILWVFLVRFGYVLFESIPGLTVLLSLATVSVSLFMYRRLWPYEVWGYLEPETSTNKQSELSSGRIDMQLVLIASGFFAFIVEAVFFKELTYICGGMTSATVIALAVSVGVGAIGVWFGGLIVSRSRKNRLELFAICELIIGLYCLVVPLLFSSYQGMYVYLAQGLAPESTSLVAVRVLCCALVLSIPASLTGISLIALISELQRPGRHAGAAVARSFGFIFLGAAAAAILGGYVLFPLLGLFKSLALSAAACFVIALFALNLNKKTGSHKLIAEDVANKVSVPITPRMIGTCFFALFIAGFVFMAVEVNYLELLAAVIGNSVYAISLMLFAILLGLGLGAKTGHYLFSKVPSINLLFSLLFFCFGSVLLLSVFRWNSLPLTFGSYGPFSFKPGFAARETVRAWACILMMFPPAFLAGTCFSIALVLPDSLQDRRLQLNAMISAIGANALGGIAGIVVGAFVLMPMIGIQRTIYIAVVVCLFTGVLIALVSGLRKNPYIYGSAFVTVFLLIVQPTGFDYTEFASGASVNFQSQPNGAVIAHSESLDGGLTTVSITHLIDGTMVNTLVSNGIRQGDSALQINTRGQLGQIAASLIHTESRNSALVIGYGTGVSANAIKLAGYSRLDIVDQNRRLVTLSNTYFSDMNASVSEQSGVASFPIDGRDFLRLYDRKYDLISMNLPSIEIADAASFYNREFYELAAKRMADDGVLQQTIQLRKLTALDLACVLSTIRVVFPEVSLYIFGDHGIIIAAKKGQNLSEDATIHAMQSQPGLMNLFDRAGVTVTDLDSHLVLTSADINRLIKLYSASSDFLISNDDNLALEFSTPKGTVLDVPNSKKALIRFLSQFSTLLKNQNEHSAALIKELMDSST